MSKLKPLMREETYKPLLKTKRFDIFYQRVVRNPKQGMPRDVYTAWFHCEDIPKPVCVVTIWAECPYYDNYVEWVEVSDDWRRQGVATEVMRALRKKLGKLDMIPGSDDGEAFIAAKEKSINAKVQNHPVKKRVPARVVRRGSAKRRARVGNNRRQRHSR